MLVARSAPPSQSPEATCCEVVEKRDATEETERVQLSKKLLGSGIRWIMVFAGLAKEFTPGTTREAVEMLVLRILVAIGEGR